MESIYIVFFKIGFILLFIILVVLSMIYNLIFSKIIKRMEKYHPSCRKHLMQYQISGFLSVPPIILNIYSKVRFGKRFEKIYSYKAIEDKGDIKLLRLLDLYKKYSRFYALFINIGVLFFITLFIMILIIVLGGGIK